MEKTPNHASIEPWLESLRLNNNSIHTIKAYQCDLGQFASWVAAKDFDTTDLAARTYLGEVKTKLAQATFNRRIASIRKWGEFYEIPLLVGYRAPKPFQAAPKALAELAMVEKMVAYGHETGRHDIAALVALQGFAGLRIGEVMLLRREDFDLKERTITVHGKGQKKREIPLTEQVWFEVEMIYELAGDDEKMFTRSYSSAGKLVKQIFEHFDEPDMTSHSLRSTAATHMHLSGAPMRVVQELLGHDDIRTTQRYTKAPMEEMRKAMEAMV